MTIITPFSPRRNGFLRFNIYERPWTPLDLTVAPFAIWNFSNEASVSLNGSNISLVNDLSGNARHLIQATAGNQPAYATVAENGKKAIRTSTGKLLSTGATSTANISCCLVVGTSTNYFPVEAFLNTQFFNGIAVYPTLTGIGGGVWSGFSGINFTDATAGYVTTELNSTLINFVTNTQAIYINGTLTSRTTSVSIVSSVNHARIGDIYSDPTATGDCQCWILLGYVPTTNERDRLIGWAAWEFGLVGKLDAAHPYKLSAPTIS